MLAHTMRRRLAPGGCAVMVNAIRQRVFLPAFVGAAESLGLRVHLVDVDPTQTSACDGAPGFALSVNGMPTDISCSGIMGKGQGYEGGYKLFLIDRADAPYPWTEFASLVPY